MELILNLLWLLLAVPLVALCWHATQSALGPRKYRPLHFGMLAVCLLALLFPVVSASDDLNAMRAELEESNSARSSLKSTAADSSNSHPQFVSATADAYPAFPGFRPEACGEVLQYAQSLPKRALSTRLGDRAPPLS
jgi:hypothetical protein